MTAVNQASFGRLGKNKGTGGSPARPSPPLHPAGEAMAMGPSPRGSALPDKATAVGKSAGLEGGEDELSPGSPAPGDEAERGGLG